MKEKTKKELKAIWNTLVDVKDELMVRLWAIKHEKAYRNKVVWALVTFASALVIISEITCVCRGVKLDWIDLFIFCLSVVLMIVYVIERSNKK